MVLSLSDILFIRLRSLRSRFRKVLRRSSLWLSKIMVRLVVLMVSGVRVRDRVMVRLIILISSLLKMCRSRSSRMYSRRWLKRKLRSNSRSRSLFSSVLLTWVTLLSVWTTLILSLVEMVMLVITLVAIMGITLVMTTATLEVLWEYWY